MHDVAELVATTGIAIQLVIDSGLMGLGVADVLLQALSERAQTALVLTFGEKRCALFTVL
jgi:hypothetical protein